MAVLMLLRSCLAPARRRPIHPAGPVALCELEEAVEEQQLERGVRSEQGGGARVARADAVTARREAEHICDDEDGGRRERDERRCYWRGGLRWATRIGLL